MAAREARGKHLDFPAPGDDTPAVRSGKLVAGRFLLQGKLGSGPGGVTFQGLDQAADQPVVVKILDGTRVRADKLPRPLKGLLDQDLPPLVRPLSSGFEEGSWYFVRPWVEGETIEVRLWREPLPWAEALGLFRAAAKALVPLHRAGLAHLGISPANLLVNPQGRLLVLDAGMSYLDPVGPRLRVLPSMDLQANIAPEQALGGRAPDARADLFSLGLLLHELLTGKGAFSGAYPLAALARLLVGEPPPLVRWLPSAPVWVDELLASLLAKTPEKRPADAAALLQALDAYQDRPPVTPRIGRFGEREQRSQALLLLGGRSLADRPDALPQAEAIGKLARKVGLDGVSLPDGSAVFPADPRRPLREQLRPLADLLVEARARYPRAPLVLAGGQGELLGRLPRGDLPDRAAALLQIEARRCKDGAPGLRTDGFVAALLQGDFPVASDDEGYLLGPGAAPAAPAVPGGTAEEAESAELAAQQARMDTMEPRRKAALRAAAIFGEQSWRSGIEEILGTSVDWPALLESGLLRPRLPSRFPRETEFEFVEPELRRALYLSLIEDDRRLGHRTAARWLEAAGATPEPIALHLEQAHDAARFTDFCVRAAQDLLDHGDPEASLRWLERGEGAGAEDLSALLALRLRTLLRLGQRTHARRAALRGLEGLPKSSDGYFSTLGYLLETCGLVGDFKRLMSAAERLLKHAPTPVTAAWSQAATQGALAALRIGKFALADSFLEKLVMPPSSPGLRGRLLAVRALRASFSGYPAASLTLHRAASAAFREAGEDELVCAMEAGVARDLLDAGATFEAELLATQTLNWSRGLALPETEARCKVVLGLALQRGGDLELARSTVREATSFFGGRGNKLFEGEARCTLASILLASSDLDGAYREVERAQGALSSFPPFQLRALALLAQARLAQGRAEEATRLCAQAAGLGEPMAPVVDAGALLKPLRAQIAQVNGQRQEARQLFLEIEQHLAERAGSFDDPTLREAFLRHVPEHAKLLQLARLFSILPPAHDDPDTIGED